LGKITSKSTGISLLISVKRREVKKWYL